MLFMISLCILPFRSWGIPTGLDPKFANTFQDGEQRLGATWRHWSGPNGLISYVCTLLYT